MTWRWPETMSPLNVLTDEGNALKLLFMLFCNVALTTRARLWLCLAIVLIMFEVTSIYI